MNEDTQQTQDTDARTLVPVDEMPISWKTINMISKTEMVPKAFRGRPSAMLGAMLAGRELGLPPMESLRAIDVIDGRPSLSGELMLRLIREKGHKVKFPTMTSEKVVAIGIRAEDPDDQMEVEFTIEDAKRAGLAGKGNWKNYPQMMMMWRCVTMLGRFHFPDVIGAVKMTYTPDDLGDPEWMPSEAEANALLVDQTDEPVEAEIVDDGDSEAPDDPEEGEDIEDAEIVEDEPAQEPVSPPERPADDRKQDLGATPHAEPESLLSVEAEQWAMLNASTSIADPTIGNRDDIERRTRKLYALMRAVGLWPDLEDGVDQLHHDLMTHYGASHWSELQRKANMQAFAEWAFGTAKATIEAHREGIGASKQDPFEGLT